MIVYAHRQRLGQTARYQVDLKIFKNIPLNKNPTLTSRKS